MVRRGSLLLLIFALAAPATGILVDTSSPERYEQPPPDDPGWQNIGRRGTTSAIYLGQGWVLTARHSSVGPVELNGQTYQPVEGSMHWVSSPLGRLKADLMLFRLTPEPELPSLTLRRRPMRDGEQAVLIGYGQGRGAPARSGPGFRFDGRGVKRWGTNRVEPGGTRIRGPNQTLTRCFSMAFGADDTDHEAQATTGDSGGAVFLRGPRHWQLAGVMLSVAGRPGQPKNESLFGNLTHAADLASYAPEIMAVLDGTFQEAAPVPVAPELP